MKILFLIAFHYISTVFAQTSQQAIPTSTITITETSYTTSFPTATGSIIPVTSNDALRLFTMKSSSIAAIVVLAYLMESINKTQAPPPSYQQGQNLPGQTYYQPPPPPPEGAYAPPPPTQNMGQRFTQFYAPPQNRSLGIKRRFCSAICCCILIGLIVGLAAGLTRGSRSGYNNCNCRTNADCIRYFGPGTYCYANCQCAHR